ncbi:NAD(P)-dependent oxidoreductase [Salipiger sp.]|uniref:NAD(P)-dependent oxidoreductase n=1 Tax=Salipiger sp. TaxID=2078585 RepID=UPI003A96E375
MSRPAVLFVSPISRELQSLLAPAYDLRFLTAATDLAELADVRAIVGHHPIGDALLDACPKAGYVNSFAAGYENVDLARLGREGRILCTTPGASAEEVADTAALLVLAGLKRLRDLDALVRSGRWVTEGQPPPRRGLGGTHVGVVGAGAVGQAILRRMGAFGAVLHYHARNPREIDATYHPSLIGLAARCEVLILAMPGGPETRNAVDREVLEALGPEGTLINLARGSVVDEPALIAALASGALGFAALDVFATEPEVPAALRALPNTLFTPHYAGASLQARLRKGQMLIDSMGAYFAGRDVPYRIT